MDYVQDFVPKHSGKGYIPHVTVGLGNRAFVEQMVAERFDAFRFKATSVSIYQLGDFGTAQKKLWSTGLGK